MKTILLLFALFFVGTTLSAQIVKTQKVQVSKVSVQSKTVDTKEQLVTGKKGLVKKHFITHTQKKIAIRRKK